MEQLIVFSACGSLSGFAWLMLVGSDWLLGDKRATRSSERNKQPEDRPLLPAVTSPFVEREQAALATY